MLLLLEIFELVYPDIDKERPFELFPHALNLVRHYTVFEYFSLYFL